MQKIILILLTLIFAAACTSCKTPDDSRYLIVDPPPPEPPVYFEAQYIRTDGYHEGEEYPAVTVISSAAELNQYYEDNRDKYNLERRETVYSDTTPGFLDAVADYTDDFFRDSCLILVRLEEGSGSVRHRVERIIAPYGNIEITRLLPEIGTTDMAQWHIIIELERSSLPEQLNVVLYSQTT